jgi:predicted permease
VLNDIRAAFMRLRRSPGFVLGATLSLAIGMSLGTAVFSIVDAVLNRPLPYGEPDRVGRFYMRPAGLDMRTPYATAIVLQTLRAEATAFSSVAAATYRFALFTNGEQRVELGGDAVTPNYFETMQARPLLGRLFRSGDVTSSNEVVISHEFWTSHLAADSGVIGRALSLTTEDERGVWHVVGVLPPGFAYPQTTSVWFVLDESVITREAAEPGMNSGWYGAIGRLKPGASMAEAQVQVNALFTRIYANDTQFRGRIGGMESLRLWVLNSFRQSLELWSAAALIILLLCAVNFATMSLARGMRRRSEIAVRAALGASRLDIVRELVAEALVLALGAGAMTVLLAWWLVSYAAQLLGGVMLLQPGITWPVVLFGVGATVVVGFIFAVAPAAELAKVDLRTVLSSGSMSTTARGAEMRGQRLLVALQLSLALTAVATVTALIQSERNLLGQSANFDYSQIVFADVYSSDTSARLLGTPALERLSMTPGVGRIATYWQGRSAFVWNSSGTIVNSPRPWISTVSTNMFDVLGVRLIAGRLPTQDEVLAGNAYVAAASFSRRLSGTDRGAAGMRVRVKIGRGARDWATIVGVVPDLGGLPMWGINAPLYSLREPTPSRYAQYIIGVSGDAKVRAREISRSLDALGPSISKRAKSAAVMMDEWNNQSRGRHMFLIGVASLALLLAIVGVYGMTSYTTEVRLREFGIRIALGANAPRLVRTMFADMWWMAPLGIGAGLFAAGRLTAYLDALYRNPLMTQPLVRLHFAPTAATAVTLFVIMLVGSSLPMRRVLRLDVMRTVNSQ